MNNIDKASQGPHDCKLCGATCADHRSFLRHERESCLFSDPELFRCDICPAPAKTFKRLSDLARHVRNQHAQGKIICTICGKRSRSDAHAEHLRTKHGIEPIELSQDNMLEDTVDQGNSLKQGYTITSLPTCTVNTLEKPLELPVARITAPIMSTAPTSQYKECGLCSEKLDINRPKYLQKHINTHIEECSQKHWCNECDVYFLMPDDLNFHLASASHGNCGYPFGSHKCSGHHPKTSLPDNDSIYKDRKRQQRRPQRNSHDEFVYRVRTFEKQRIEHHTRCLQELMECLLPRPCRTSPYAGGSAPARSTASRRTVPAGVHYDARVQASIEKTSIIFGGLSLRAVAA